MLRERCSRPKGLGLSVSEILRFAQDDTLEMSCGFSSSVICWDAILSLSEKMDHQITPCERPRMRNRYD